MRLEIKCPFCGRLICKMAKGSEIEINCKNCKAVFVLGLIQEPKQLQANTS